MPNIGPMELIVVGIIALVIFGPKRLPELGSSLGSGIRGSRVAFVNPRSTGRVLTEIVEPAKAH